MTTKRTTIYLDDRDCQALSTLQAQYGLATRSDAIRFAVRAMAAQTPGERPSAVYPTGVSEAREGGAGWCWDEEKVEFLMDELTATQQALAQEQEGRVRVQEELAGSQRELQTLN
jgi:hypothetical protein